jgi:hypothetical protein
MDFSCYEVEPGRVEIKPASHRRQWMDDTPEGFANRCVPLSVANANGWEILSPVTVAARWSGGAGIKDVSISFPDGTEGLPGHFVESHFGSGVITFNPLLIFRTPPGYDLWVTGTPNDAKDSIAPLTAVVETDWMPFTFSMNWRFTRKDRWVRFNRGEPFCFVTPVKREAIEDFAPRLKALSADPELMQAYAAVKDQRASGMFSDKPKERFLGWYSRGVQPVGSDISIPGHRTKSRPRPFERS